MAALAPSTYDPLVAKGDVAYVPCDREATLLRQPSEAIPPPPYPHRPDPLSRKE